jgi:hypothetical protein
VADEDKSSTERRKALSITLPALAPRYSDAFAFAIRECGGISSRRKKDSTFAFSLDGHHLSTLHASDFICA